MEPSADRGPDGVGFATEVPRVGVRDPAAGARMIAQKPVVIENTRLVDIARRKWDLVYLARVVSQHRNSFRVYSSSQRVCQQADMDNNQGRFLHEVDEVRTMMDMDKFVHMFVQQDPTSLWKQVPYDSLSPVPPVRVTGPRARDVPLPELPPDLTMPEIRRVVVPGIERDLKDVPLYATRKGSPHVAPALPGAGRPLRAEPKDRLYHLQQVMYDGLGKQVIADFSGISWGMDASFQRRCKWQHLSLNELIILQRGVILSPRFTEGEKCIYQSYGRGTYHLVASSEWRAMYPYPTEHPCEKQSQIKDVNNPDLERFPMFAGARGYTVVLEPGEMLYVPVYWWLQCEANHGATMAISFLHDWLSKMPPVLPLQPDPTIVIPVRLNLERNAGESSSFTLSATMFAKLARGQKLTTREEDVKAQVLLLLRQVLLKEAAEQFLLELVEGRFDLPRLADVETDTETVLTAPPHVLQPWCPELAGALPPEDVGIDARKPQAPMATIELPKGL